MREIPQGASTARTDRAVFRGEVFQNIAFHLRLNGIPVDHVFQFDKADDARHAPSALNFRRQRVTIEAQDRDGLKRLLRYCARSR